MDKTLRYPTKQLYRQEDIELFLLHLVMHSITLVIPNIIVWKYISLLVKLIMFLRMERTTYSSL